MHVRLAHSFGAVALLAGSFAVTSGVSVAAPTKAPTASLDVVPRDAHVTPSGAFHFAFGGAQGHVHARILGDARGATLSDDGTFTAPAREGRWQLVVSDDVTLREVGFTASVEAKLAPLRARVPIVAIAPGGVAALEWTGGSGAIDVRLGPRPEIPGARIDRGEGGAARLTVGADAPASFEVHGVDRETHADAVARVVVARTFTTPLVAQGSRSLGGALAVGDVNGDGRPDLVVGHPERAVAGVDAGGVLLFYGRATGAFGDRPDAALDGEHAGDRFGDALVVRDVSGDGVDDVVVAAPGADLGAEDRGAVYVFAGDRGGVAAAPSRILGGEDTGDRFGSAIAVRDLDGDGAPELLVGAPGAKNPVSACAGGRVYVHHGETKTTSAFDPSPAQTIDLRDPPTQDAEALAPCPARPFAAGTALALADMDGDGVIDLAVGAPQAASGGAVDLYKGARGGRFAATPTWALHLDPASPRDGARFGAGLDAVTVGGKSLLVVRASGPAGGLWTFAPGSLGEGARPAPAGEPRTRVIPTSTARATLSGVTATAAIVADVDGDGHADYLVADARSEPTRLLAFHLEALAEARPLAPFATATTSTGHDATGAALVAWSIPGRAAAGLALLAPARTTPVGPFAGAIDVLAPAPSSALADRLRARATVSQPNIAAGDRAGAGVAFLRADGGGPLEAVVAAPAPRRAPSTRRLDRLDVAGTARAPILGAATSVPVDFDGDGVLDLAVAGPGGPAPADADDPDGCLRRFRPEGDHDSLHVYARAGDALVERAWIPARLGASVAAGDFDGDGRGDVALSSDVYDRVHIVPGRPFVAGKVVVACLAEGAAGDALAFPPGGTYWGSGTGAQLAAIGDLDRDGCDELAVGLSSAGGVAVVFGFDPRGQRCHGHASPLAFLLTVSDRAITPWPATSLARGAGDLDGDGVPDLVFGDPTPSVQIVSGAFLGAFCPNHVCPSERRGMIVQGPWRGVALGATAPSQRLVLRGSPGERKLGASIAIGDADGDRAADLAVGAPEADDGGGPSGEARIYRGPLRIDARRAPPEPWVVAVGDARDRGGFGSSLAIARDRGASWLLVGAPRSTRGRVGVDLGAAYLFALPAP